MLHCKWVPDYLIRTLHMPSWKAAGPISLHGFARRVKADPNARVRLLVVDGDAPLGVIGQEVAKAWGLEEVEQNGNLALLVQLSDGSDCIVPVRISCEGGAPWTIQLDAVSQFNLRVASGHKYDFSVFLPPEGTPDNPLELVDMDVELRLLQYSGNMAGGAVEVDGAAIVTQLHKQLFHRIVAVNEVALVKLQHAQVVARVTCVNNLSAHERMDAIGYHCFRGVVTPDTDIYLAAYDERTAVPNGGAAGTAASAGCTADTTLAQALGNMALYPGQPAKLSASHLDINNARPRPAEDEARNLVYVHCCDGEVFPVKRAVLRPALALTAAVRSDEAAPRVQVDVPTLVFDRVLIFLEALARGRDPPSFAVHLLEDLLAAARTLKFQSLERACEEKLGRLLQQLRVWSYQEVVDANSNGKCLLIMDGMVLDVTTWLPEHPGGSTIIPQQALNLDSSRFYEVYHSSRESFLYLKEFYVGELTPDQLPLVPHPPQPPSDDFMLQLRSFTSFRLNPTEIAALQKQRGELVEERTYKSF